MSDYRLGKLNGRWVAVFYENGKRSRWRLSAANAAEARAALREFVRERESLRRPKERLTVADVWADYINEKRAEGRVSTGRMQDAWKSLEPAFGALWVEDVQAATAREYTRKRMVSVGSGTVHTELGYLRAAFRQAVKNGILAQAPPISLPSKPRPKTRHLTPEEARKLLYAAQMPHVRLFIELALHTAGRPSSILDLTWDRVQIDRGYICLDNPGRDRTSKGRATVPISDDKLCRSLREARQAAQTSHVIEWAGQKVLSIKKGFAAAAKRAGLEGVTPYVIRHSAAVFMAEGGVPMSELSQYLGHSSTSVTERVYARYSPEYLRKASDAISTALYGEPKLDSLNAEGTKGAQRANGIKER